jgi:phosphoglycolate phosphatase
LHAVLEQLGTRTALYVGDSEVDAETAARADVAFALFTNGYRRSPIAEIAPRYAFDAYGELKAIVARAFASTTPA